MNAASQASQNYQHRFVKKTLLLVQTFLILFYDMVKTLLS